MVLALVSLALPPLAEAGPGYELDTVKPSFAVGAKVPRGIAIDQISQMIYVTEVITDFDVDSHGQIEQFNSSGVPTANSPFGTGDKDLFTGVAVNPVNQSIYAYQTELETPFGNFGTPRMNTFSSTGVQGASFTPTKSSVPQLAADSSGRVYFPNDSTDTVQVFTATGALEESIACTGCPGGALQEPVSVALDSAANLYVIDIANGGRAIKFKLVAGSYVYSSLLQSGGGAAAVGVDPASNDVFVGNWFQGTYHIIAYDSSGVQFDDFGGGVFAKPEFGAVGAGQIAVNQATRKVYVPDSGANRVWVFDRVASIPGPTANTAQPSSKGQLEATLSAVVDPNGHGSTDCHFEYTTAADFQANGFLNAVSIPCSSKPYGTNDTEVSALATGLTPGTTYDYQIVAATNGGSAKGGAQAFTTLPPLPPTVTTGSASAITQISATIAGSVNPNGGPVSSCSFEYTDDADFQENGFLNATSIACSPKPGKGTSNTSVSAKLSSLAAETEYRYRLLATNNSGPTEGSAKAFATLAETCATNPALCPPEEEEPEDPAPQPLPVQPVNPILTPTPPAPVNKPLKCRKGFKKKRVRGKLKCVKAKRPSRRGKTGGRS